MKTVLLPCGDRVPALGQGTWNMGDDPGARAGELAALRVGIDLGLTLITPALQIQSRRVSNSRADEAFCSRLDYD